MFCHISQHIFIVISNSFFQFMIIFTLAFYHYTFDVHIFMITSFSAACVRQYKLMQKADADQDIY
jgi:hypothetical protein